MRFFSLAVWHLWVEFNAIWLSEGALGSLCGPFSRLGRPWMHLGLPVLIFLRTNAPKSVALGLFGCPCGPPGLRWGAFCAPLSSIWDPFAAEI